MYGLLPAAPLSRRSAGNPWGRGRGETPLQSGQRRDKMTPYNFYAPKLNMCILSKSDVPFIWVCGDYYLISFIPVYSLFVD